MGSRTEQAAQVPRRKRWNRWAIVALLAVASAVGAACVLAFPSEVTRPDDELCFDEVSWRRDNAAAFRQATYDEIYNATRDRMVNDLLGRYNLVGMAKGEVTALLGEADYERAGMFPTWDMVYWLGPDHRGPWGHIDSKWLLIQLGEGDRVTRCQTATD